MKSLKLADGLWWNGILDPDLRVFDIVMRTEFGTTRVCHLLICSEKKNNKKPSILQGNPLLFLWFCGMIYM